MGSTTLWSSPRLRRRDLPTLQDLFSSCDRALLEQVIIEEFACRGSRVDKKRYKTMRCRLDASLDAMKSLSLVRGVNRGWLIAPQASYVLNVREGSITWRLHAELVPLLDSESLEQLIRNEGSFAISYDQIRKTKKRRGRTVKSPGSQTCDLLPGPLGARSYTLAPWEETLACKVWLGGDWCRRERYVALASAFWEMTFFGFEYDRAQARMAQEKATRMMSPADEDRGARLSESLREQSPGIYEMYPSDRLVRKAQRNMAERVAVLNHNESVAFYGRLLDLSSRLERRH